MATRTYLFTPEETTQFERLQALGFTKPARLSGTGEASVLWCHETHGVDFTFYPEPYVDEAGEEDSWRVEVHKRTPGRFATMTTDAWLTMTEFSALVDPASWTAMLSALKSLRCLADWNSLMQPRLQAALQTQPDPVSLSLDVG